MRDLFPVHLNLDSNPTRGEVIVYRLAKQVCNLFMISNAFLKRYLLGSPQSPISAGTFSPCHDFIG